LFEAVDAPFNGIALLVALTVEGGRSATPAASPEPMALLVRWDGDHRSNIAPAQVLANGT
jgi:hypothetical protein